jgi:hypothetical protein
MADEHKADRLRQLSLTTGGRGVGLRFRQALTQVGVPIQLGKSPGAGTGASVQLLTNFDPAYDNATILWYVEQIGRRSLFSTTTISPADNAAQSSIYQTQSGFAADFWELEIQLAGAGVPADPLQSSVIAFGVEDIPGGTNANPLGQLFYAHSFTGPSQAGAATFPMPPDASTWIVCLQMEVTSGPDTGDSASTEAVYAWKNIGGVVSLLPVVLSSPNTSYDALMSTGITTAGTTGAEAEISFTTPSGLSAGDVCLVTVTMTPVGEA